MDFPGNSHNPLGDNRKKAEKEPPKKEVVKIVSVDATIKPAPIHKRIKSIFFSGSAKSASRFVFIEVLIPALKNMVAEGTSKGIDKMLYGESPRARYGNEPGRSRYSYNNPIFRGDPRERVMYPDQPPRAITRHAPVGEILLNSRIDAENVVEELANMIEKYEVASVADLYELVGLPSAHTDNKWGWSQLKYANVRQTRDGYLIELPPAEAL